MSFLRWVFGVRPALVLLSFALGFQALPPETTPHTSTLASSYIFVSANTRSRMTDEDALRSLNSFEQKNAVAVADRIACSLTHSVRIGDALGISANSSENSFVIETDLPDDSSRYVASLLGRYAHQEYVLTFMRRPHGPDRIWVVSTGQPIADAVKAIRMANLVPTTVRENHGETEIYFFDSGSRSAEKVRALAAGLHGSVSTEQGAGTLRGDDGRAQAAAMFDADIRGFEQRNGYTLSSQLWTQNWHDATSRSCSSPRN